MRTITFAYEQNCSYICSVVPKSFKEKQNELSIKMYKDQLELESQGYGKEQITQALMIKYQCCKNKVYRHTRRAPELLKAIEG
mgnify:CR=1 FL=1